MRVTFRFGFTRAGSVIAFCIICAATAIPQAMAETKLTICSVAQNIEKYNHAAITVRARVQSDGTHGAQIYDESCGGFGIGLDVPDGAEGRSQLLAALDKGYRGTRDKVVHGTFTGVFELKVGQHPQRIMKVQRMDHITVEIKAGGPGATPIVNHE